MTMKKNISLYLPDETATMQVAGQLAACCPAGTIIFLHGDLGAGKTTFVRGFLRGLGYTGTVKSPTYTLVEPYQIDALRIFHFDLYRLTDPSELEFMGIRDYFSKDTISLIEWPNQGAAYLPPADCECTLTLHQPGRDIRILALTERANSFLSKF